MPADSKLKELYDKRSNVWEQMKALRDKKEDLSAEDDAAWDAAEADLDKIGADIDRRERMAKMDEIVTKPLDETRQKEMSAKEITAEEKYERAYSNYMVFGSAGLQEDEKRTLAEGFTELRVQGTAGNAVATAGNAGGGYLVPPGFLVKMIEVLKAYGGLINYAEGLNTADGGPLQWPTNDDTANVGAILAENNQVPTQDFTFASKSIGAYMYTSKLVLVSYQLLQDSAFDLNTWLPSRLGIRIGRALAGDLITGNGTTAPEGLFTNATTGVTGPTGVTGFFGTGGATGTAYGNLIDMQHSIDPAYRTNAKWVFNDAMLKGVRKLVDGNGRPLWEPLNSGSLTNGSGTDAPQQGLVPAGGNGGTLLGDPVVIDQGVAAPGLNAKSAAYGDIGQAYIVRRVAGAQTLRLAERYADYLQVGFFGYARFDAKLQNASAVKLFVGGAS